MENKKYFSLVFGKEPMNYVSRPYETETIIDDFKGDNPINTFYIITGIRGSGKTVLLSNIANLLRNEDDWIVVDPRSKDNLLENIASELYDEAKIKHLFIEKEFSFSFHGITFSLKGKTPVLSINTLLKKMLEHIKKKNKKVLITIDEVENSPEMKRFIQVFESFNRENYPIRLLMTGLYENINSLVSDKTLTFLLRAPKINLGPLSIQAISAQYQLLLYLPFDKALEMAKMSKGYAYAYQAIGYLFEKYNKKEFDQTMYNEFDLIMSNQVYEKVFSELSNCERKLLFAFNGKDIIETSELIESTGFDQKKLGVYRSRMINKGVLASLGYGQLGMALPRFNVFLEYKK